MVECAKLAFADREAWYGDPAVRRRAGRRPALGGSTPTARGSLVGAQRRGSWARLSGRAAPAARLRDRARCGGRRGRASQIAATGPGRTGAARPAAPGGPRAARPTRATPPPRYRRPVRQRDDRDAERRLAAELARHPRARLLPGHPGADVALAPGLPNSLAPGKRPRTTLSPSLALRDGEPYLAFGTPGGDQQDQWTLAFFLNHAVFGMNLQEAIDAPAFHTGHFPSSSGRVSPGRGR